MIPCLMSSSDSAAADAAELCDAVISVYYRLQLFVCSVYHRQSAVVSMLDCKLRGLGFESPSEQKFSSRFLLHLCHIANSAMVSTLTVRCRWENEMARDTTGHPSYAEAKKMKSHLQTHDCMVPRGDCFASSSSSSWARQLRILNI